MLRKDSGGRSSGVKKSSTSRKSKSSRPSRGSKAVSHKRKSSGHSRGRDDRSRGSKGSHSRSRGSKGSHSRSRGSRGSRGSHGSHGSPRRSSRDSRRRRSSSGSGRRRGAATTLAGAAIGTVILASEVKKGESPVVPPSAGSARDYLASPAAHPKPGSLSWDVKQAGMYQLKASAIVTGVEAAARQSRGWLKFEVCRDSYQVLSLALAAIVLPAGFTELISALTDLLGFDLLNFFPDFESKLIIFATMAVLSVLGLIIFCCLKGKSKSAEKRVHDGLEVKNWEDERSCTVSMTRWTVIILTTLYLPLSQASLKIITCHPDFALGCDDVTWFAAIPVLLLVTLCFPCQLRGVIKREQLTLDVKPYDAEGNRREITEELYQEEVENSSSPYSFLFKGYTQQWSSYKVLMMFMKLMLAVPVVIFVPDNVFFGSEEDVAGLAVLGTITVLVVWTVQSWRSAPFVDPWDNRLDCSGRTTALITAAVALILYLANDLEDPLDVAVTGVNLANLGAMILIPILGSKTCAAYKKRRAHRLDFSMDKTSGLPLLFSPNMDPLREKKIRVWQPFWDALFITAPEFRAPDKLKPSWADTKMTPPYLKNFQGTVAERHEENKKIVSALGADRVAKAVKPISRHEEEDRTALVETLVGIDVFYDCPAAGASKFGKLYVVPFPFTCVMYFDDVESFVLIGAKELPSLLKQNDDKEVRRRRHIRHQIRGAVGRVFNFSYSTTLSVSRTEHYTDQNGHRQTRTVSESVRFTFSKGRVGVDQLSGAQWTAPDGSVMLTSAGFSPFLLLLDGRGTDSQGTSHHREFKLGPAGLGITPDLKVNPGLEKFLYANGNGEGLEEGVERIRKLHKAYRLDWRDQFVNKAETLTYHFWSFVYNQPGVSRKYVEAWLKKQEGNKRLRELPKRHARGLDSLYARLDYVDASAGNLWWFCYWHDIWRHNGVDTKLIRDRPEVFDPRVAGSLAYTPMDEGSLVNHLSRVDARLLKFWTSTQLDALYSGLDRFVRAGGGGGGGGRKSRFM